MAENLLQFVGGGIWNGLEIDETQLSEKQKQDLAIDECYGNPT
ncbi:MAG TPA: hypothetical protein PLA19_00865 [Candidatus Pacearchaeota archaeon]|nr:hypothetical protein [Candidatus Pacearchaeota archaeon]